MKTTLAILALLVAGGAHAQAVSGTNSSDNSSQAAANNNASPTQVIQSYGSKYVGNAPSMAVGGSIGSHVCEASVGASGGWFSGAAGAVFTYSRESCVFLNVGDFLQQSAHMEEASGRKDEAQELRDSSYELMAEISPKIRAILSRNKLLKGQAAVQSDKSGTVGLQAANYRVE